MVLGISRVVDCLVGLVAPWNVIASFVLLPSAADRLPLPFRSLAQAPQLTLLLAGGGYVAFLVLFLPLYAISFIVSATGAWFVLLGAIYMGGRGLTQTISYPGASKQIQRDIELEYTKNVSSRLVSFVNGLRLWLQLVRDLSVLPSGMAHFRALHAEIKSRSREGDIWVLARALEELTAQANVPAEDAGARGGASAATSPLSAAATAAAAAGANALAPSAAAEAECLLECLTELLPTLEEALGMTAKLPECTSAYDFDRARQLLLAPGVGDNDSFARTFSSLEGLATKLMKLSQRLRRRRKRDSSGGVGGGGGGGGDSTIAAGGSDGGEASDDDEVDAPTEEEGAPKDTGFPGAFVKSCWKSRRPFEGAAGFGLMRHEMLIKSNAQQIWLAMSDGTLLDCCLARAYGGSNEFRGIGASVGERDGDGDGNDRGSTGCVLFCNPNAGFYESTALAGDGDRSWVSFYTSAGCDVFLYNYRGYGRSGGSASPSKINEDVREIVAYLREELGATRLAVHGESIGGVAAANVARHCQVDLLVLDRSFSSLSAVAQRLMGAWTKPAIWAFTGWNANVASDYLASNCYKVLACDPEDAMISEPSSTKAGVAVMLELGASSSSLDVYQPPKAYKVADHTRSCPPVERVSLPLSFQERLSSLQIAHFCACLRFVARTAPRVGQPTSGIAGAGGSRRRRRRRGELPAHVEAQGESPVELEMVSIVGDVDRSQAQEDASLGGEDAPSSDPLTEGMIDVSYPLGEVWVLLSRVDGLCGRMLGRAVSKGFDDVRAWVCCLVVFGPIARGEPVAASTSHEDAPASLPVESASQRLQTLLKEHPDELASNPYIAYVSQMLQYLAQRILRAASAARSTSMLPDQPSARFGSGAGTGVGSVADAMRDLDGLESGGMPRGHGLAAVQDASTTESAITSADRSHGIELVGDDLLGGRGTGLSLGKVLPLRCGHNNAYSDAERRALLEHLALQGWVAPDKRSLEALSKGGRAQQ